MSDVEKEEEDVVKQGNDTMKLARYVLISQQTNIVHHTSEYQYKQLVMCQDVVSVFVSML
ncbi:hypothetical protein G3N97_20025 [Paraburkholderia sp. Ac-20347]|nr:hypothetical protein [Paraburkholderia sp. Ac-20347]